MKGILSFVALSLLSFTEAYTPVPYKNAAPGNPVRKDIDNMGKEERELFILAMAQWQKGTANPIGGYFQVTGIHGAPHRNWDGAPGSTGDPNTGYCPHGTLDFYLWHRPYLALYEQQMRVIAKGIADNWNANQRSTYQAAYNTLRLPYWDWAKGSGGAVSSWIANRQVSVTNPSSGQGQTINNPLYSYTLTSGGNLGNGIYVGRNSGDRTTYRGDTYTSDLRNGGASLRRNTALLFNTPNVCWNLFATYDDNEHQQCQQVSVPSLESTHNTVHNTIGGTMVNLDVSAFDPIFFMHHCNVDRIGAIWQAINPSTTIQRTYSDDYTYALSPGNRDSNQQYLPFRKSQGNTDWWRSGQSMDVRKFGYTYPEIADGPNAQTALARANAIYGNGRTQQAVAAANSKLRRDGGFMPVPRQAAAQALTIPPEPTLLAPFADVLIGNNGSFNEYSVMTTISKAAAPGTSFNVHLFFGDAPSGGASNYLSAPNRIGGFSVSQAGSMDTGKTVSGAVPMTDALLNLLIQGKIKDLKPQTVRRFVRARMVWRLVTTDGQDIGGRARDNALNLKVVHTVVTPEPASADILPVLAPIVEIVDATTQTQAAPIPAEVLGTTTVATAAAATSAASSTSSADAAATTS